MSSKRIVIPGGTGYLGRALTSHLVVRGDEVIQLTRGQPQSGDGWRSVHWDVSPGDWIEHLDGADAVVHLSGRRVDTRPTRRNVDELISSRVDPVRVVGDALEECAKPPPVWIQSASLAIFGDTGEAVVDEDTTPSGIGPRQMVTVCLAWESAFRHATQDVRRAVLLRIGVGFGGVDDPAIARLARLTRWGLGGKIGSGRQWMSWIALDDVMAFMLRAIDDDQIEGTYHLTSPNPVRNEEMMATMRRLLGKRLGLPSPAVITRIGAPLLGSDWALPLTGRRCVSKRLDELGFEFQHPTFEAAARIALESAGFGTA